MHNEWVVGRPTLGLKDARHGLGRLRIGSESVDGLCRQRDRQPLTKQLHRLAKRIGILGGQDFRVELVFANAAHDKSRAYDCPLRLALCLGFDSRLRSRWLRFCIIGTNDQQRGDNQRNDAHQLEQNI